MTGKVARLLESVLDEMPEPEQAPVTVCVATDANPLYRYHHYECDPMLCPEAAAEAAEQDRGCYVCGFVLDDCIC